MNIEHEVANPSINLVKHTSGVGRTVAVSGETGVGRCNTVTVTQRIYGRGRRHLVTKSVLLYYILYACIFESEFASAPSLPPFSPRVLVTFASMSCHSSPIPFISISPAPVEDPIVEPFSPFSALSVPSNDQNAFRPSHLTPPTTITSFKRSPSPLHPAPAGQGLESQKFQVLLAATKRRKVSGGSNQSVEFRKEIAMKAHKNGHCRSLRH